MTMRAGDPAFCARPLSYSVWVDRGGDLARSVDLARRVEELEYDAIGWRSITACPE